MTAQRYVAQLRAAVEAVDIHSESTFLWFEEPSPDLPESVHRHLDPIQVREQLRWMLTSRLYRDFYCRGGAARPERHTPPVEAVEARDFARTLAAANGGEGFWDEGWELVSAADGRLDVARDGLRLRVRSTDCEPIPATDAIGAPVKIRGAKGLSTRSPGYYLAMGDVPITDESRRGVIRLYWNVSDDGAPHLMRLVTTVFNLAEVPFRLKLVDHPGRYGRCDSGVLYLLGSDWARAAAAVAKVHAAAVDHLLDAVPALTKPLAPGLGLAEGPAGGESFGLHRCRLLAEGILSAHDQGEMAIESRLDVVAGHLRRHGVDPEHPYLTVSAADTYRMEPLPPRRPSPRPHVSQATRTQLLDVAEGIGRKLCEQAVWYRDRCTWLNTEPVPTDALPVAARRLGTMVPSLYSGSSGTAVFLGELSRVTGDEQASRTALGAVRHALDTIGWVPPAQRLGLYEGSVGVALAAARLGTILGCEHLLDDAARTVTAALELRAASRDFDVLYGDAGAVLGLLVLRDLLGDDALLDASIELGDELLATAERRLGGYAWRSPSYPEQLPLTGLSHGAAGVGLALSTLFAATGKEAYRDGARSAFEYERGLFDPEVGNWPDLREFSARRTGQPAAPFMVAWCHGAPGIALSRLHASALLGDDTARQETLIGLATTVRVVADAVEREVRDFSLCHGLAGLADVLLDGRRWLGDASPEWRELPEAVAAYGAERFAGRGRPWPCGLGHGERPDLMLGVAGIGYLYLRLADAATPSVLLPTSPEFTSVVAPRPAPRGPGSVATVGGAGSTTSQGVRYRGRMTDAHVRAVAHLALEARGFAPPPPRPEGLREWRWREGCRLRDVVLPRRLPEFADIVDYLSLAETHPRLWESLPYMLSFGYQQATALGPLLDAAMPETAAETAAVFSAVLSLFDHLVDETPHTDVVFAIEAAVLPSVLGEEDDAAALLRAHAQTDDRAVRLLCALFEILRAGLRPGLHAADDPLRRRFVEVLRALFTAQRTVTLSAATSVAELAVLATVSTDKSVLPFVALLYILAMTIPGGTLRRRTEVAAADLGAAVAIADDLMDVATDARRGSPTPVVARLARAAALRGSTDITDDDIIVAIGGAVDDLLEHLPSTDGRNDGGGRLEDLRAFTVDTVARWVEWETHRVKGADPAAVGRPVRLTPAATAAAGHLLAGIVERPGGDDCSQRRLAVVRALIDARDVGFPVQSSVLAREAEALLQAPPTDSDHLGLMAEVVGLIGEPPLAAVLDDRIRAALRASQGGRPYPAATLLSGVARAGWWQHQADAMRLAGELEAALTRDVAAGRDVPWQPLYRTLDALVRLLPDSPAIAPAVSSLRGMQRSDGAWGDRGADAGATALAILALVSAGAPSTDDTVAAGLGHLLSTQTSGGVWQASAIRGPRRLDRDDTTAYALRALVAISQATAAPSPVLAQVSWC